MLAAVLVTGCISLGGVAGAGAEVTVRTSPSPVTAGTPLEFAIRVMGVETAEGNLFYRPIGAVRYRRMGFERSAGGGAVVSLPGSVTAAPGLEFYAEVQTDNGIVETDPAVYPARNPHRLEVLDSPPGTEFVLLSPRNSVRAPTETLVLSPPPGFELGGYRVLLDGIDVTPALRVREETLEYTPPAPLAPGAHRLGLAPSGGVPAQEVLFDVSEGPSPGGRTGVLTARGSLSFNYGGNIGNKDGSRSDTTSANVHVEADAEKGDFAIDFSGINLQYVKDAPDAFTISSGYLLTMRCAAQTLEVGDLSIVETPLVASGFSRRGAQLMLKGGPVEAHLFNVRAETVEGFEPGISFSDSDRQVYGASVRGTLLPNDRLTVHVAGVMGENQAVSGFNTASLLGASKGRTLGARVSAGLFGATLGAEYAVSWFDPDTSDAAPETRDDAYEIKLERDVGVGLLSLGYLRYGSTYATIADPNFTGDREGYDGSFSTGVGPLSWGLSGSYVEDNVDGDRTRPVVVSATGATTVGLSVPDWPALQAGYSLADQHSEKVPAGAEEADNRNQTVTASLAFGRGIWNISFSTGFGFLNDRRPVDEDARTRSYNVAGGLAAGGFTVCPGFTLDQTFGAQRNDRTRLATFSLSVPLWPERLTLSSQASYQLADASDGSVDTRTTNGNARLAFSIGDLLERVHAGWLDVEVGVSGAYNRFEDRKNGANDEEYTVLLNFNLGAPYDFEVERPW